MVYDKEIVSSDNMVNMGLSIKKLLISNFIYLGLVYIFFSILVTAILKRAFFNYINFGVIYLIIIIYYFWMISMALLLGSIFTSS